MGGYVDESVLSWLCELVSVRVSRLVDVRGLNLLLGVRLLDKLVMMIW